MSKIWLAVIFAFISIPIVAGPNKAIILGQRSETFINSDCAKNDSCSLKEVNYVVENYKVLVEGTYSYGTRLLAGYRTGRIEDLTDYVFVQFKLGCVYYSNDKNAPNTSVVTYNFNQPGEFRIKNWQIDSLDSDPAYNSHDDSRHNDYRWSPYGDPFNVYYYYGIQKPVNPYLYVLDHPGTAFTGPFDAKNISLKFKMCIYKTKEVPKEGTPEELWFAEPISCFYWGSSFVYDFDNKEFRNPDAIVPACFKQ